jgi:hypothetical protein
MWRAWRGAARRVLVRRVRRALGRGEPTFLEDGFQVTFNQPGRYLIQAAAGYQSYRWVSSDILVTVGDGVSPDFGLDVYQRTEILYQDAGKEGFLADIKTHDAMLLDGEKARWTLTTESDPDSLPAVLSLVDESDDHVTVLFSDLESEGEVTYTLTYDAGIYHAQEDITVEVVANTPDGLPTGVSYPETTLYLDPAIPTTSTGRWSNSPADRRSRTAPGTISGFPKSLRTRPPGTRTPAPSHSRRRAATS